MLTAIHGIPPALLEMDSAGIATKDTSQNTMVLYSTSESINKRFLNVKHWHVIVVDTTLHINCNYSGLLEARGGSPILV